MSSKGPVDRALRKATEMSSFNSGCCTQFNCLRTMAVMHLGFLCKALAQGLHVISGTKFGLKKLNWIPRDPTVISFDSILHAVHTRRTDRWTCHSQLCCAYVQQMTTTIVETINTRIRDKQDIRGTRCYTDSPWPQICH